MLLLWRVGDGVRGGSERLESRWGDGTTNRLWSKLTPLQIFNHPPGLMAEKSRIHAAFWRRELPIFVPVGLASNTEFIPIYI